MPSSAIDYTFLMRRLSGVQLKAEQKIDPDDQRFGAWALALPKGEQVAFALDPDFARSLKGRKATLRVTYLDQGDGTSRQAKSEPNWQIPAAGKPPKWTCLQATRQSRSSANRPGTHNLSLIHQLVPSRHPNRRCDTNAL